MADIQEPATVQRFSVRLPEHVRPGDRFRLRISLFESHPGQDTYGLTKGEAKRHEIWLGLWDKPVEDADLESFAACTAP